MVSSVMLRISVFAGVPAGFLLALIRSCAMLFVHADMRRKHRSYATVLGRRPVEDWGHYQKRTVLT
jgi:hypothetical protein